jgi:thioredoxin 1
MQTTIIVLGLVIVIFGSLYYMARVKMKNIPMVDDHKKIITLTDKNIQNQIKNKLVLVDFWASWCAPCRMMAPVLNEMAEELTGNKAIGKLNIEQYQSIAATYKVRSIPTMILFKNGKEINRFVGVKSKDFLLKEINKVN